MLRFQTEQRTIEVAGATIGGQPGEFPTALAATIFYEGHDIVRDIKRGDFDKKRAEELVAAHEAAAEDTGNPALLHVFAAYPEAMETYLSFAADATTGPLLVDSPSLDVRLAGVRWAVEAGAIDRIVYNSLNLTVTDEEIEALRASGVSCAILLAFNPKNPGLNGRLKLLEDGGDVTDAGLLDLASAAGITKILVDPAVTPIGNGAGVAVRTALAAKAKWGHPVGSGIHNAPASLPWLNDKDRNVKDCVDVATNVLHVAMCADYLLYGPIEHAPHVFPAVAVADAIVADAAEELGTDISKNRTFTELVG